MLKLLLAITALAAVVAAIDESYFSEHGITGNMDWMTFRWGSNMYGEYDFTYDGAGCEPDSGIEGNPLVCHSKERSEYITAGYCYVYFYKEMGCTGEPLQFYGFDVSAGDITNDDTVYLYEDDDFVEIDYGMRVADFGATAGLYYCSDGDNMVNYGAGSYYSLQGDCKKEVPGNLPIGCTDFDYAGQLPFSRYRDFYQNNDQYTANSVLIICDGELECPRQCLDPTDNEVVDCTTYDHCDRPCVGACADGQYCAVDQDQTMFACADAQYGTSSWFTVVSLVDGDSCDSKKRDYYEPVISHFENALVADLAYASQGIIPEQAIVIDSVEYYSHQSCKFNLQFTINVDTVNALMGSSYSVADLSAYMQDTVFASSGQTVGGTLGGPFTYYFDLTRTFPTADISGEMTSGIITDDSDDEWRSFEVPSSWTVDFEISISGSSALTAGWVALVSFVAVLLW